MKLPSPTSVCSIKLFKLVTNIVVVNFISVCSTNPWPWSFFRKIFATAILGANRNESNYRVNDKLKKMLTKMKECYSITERECDKAEFLRRDGGCGHRSKNVSALTFALSRNVPYRWHGRS